ncbi:MAG: TolC family protein [Candidatus Latescibacteria bacterium]|nr:TolC family protein [Candidatus Latescibacterota bacterium]
MRPRSRALRLGVLLVLALLGPDAATGQALSLQEVQQQALLHHPRVIAARKTWEAARARQRGARLPPDPHLSLEYEGLTSFQAPYGERNLELSQVLEFPGKPRFRSRLAGYQAQLAEADYEALRLEITAAASAACGRLWAARDLLSRAGENLRLAEDFRDKTQKRVEAGDASPLEVLRAEVEAGRVAAEQATAANQLQFARAELNALLGQAPDAPLEVSGGLEYQPLRTELPLLQKRALEQRPDLCAADLRTRAARAGEGLSRAGLVPDLEVSAGRQHVRQEDRYWRTGVALTLPLWSVPAQRGVLAGAQAEAAAAEALQAGRRNQALLEVQEAYLEVRTAEIRLLLYRDRVVPRAEEGYQLARRSYDEGASSYLEILDAGRALAEARLVLVQALLDHHLALARLTQAVGDHLNE